MLLKLPSVACESIGTMQCDSNTKQMLRSTIIEIDRAGGAEFLFLMIIDNRFFISYNVVSCCATIYLLKSKPSSRLTVAHMFDDKLPAW
jgi:hypothetical protein